MAKFYTYVLMNGQGKFYIGHTQHLSHRLHQHNDTEAAPHKFAPKHGPWELVWSEEHPDRSSAIRRELQIKAMKSSQWIRENLLS